MRAVSCYRDSKYRDSASRGQQCHRRGWCAGADAADRHLMHPLPLPAGNFNNLRTILLAPLPRAYEEAQNGVAQACSEGEPKLIGQGVQVDSLMQCAADLKNRLEEEVVKPLKHWYAAYKNIVVRWAGVGDDDLCVCVAGSQPETPPTTAATSEKSGVVTAHCMQDRMTKLEQLRLELDSRRRTVETLQRKRPACHGQRAPRMRGCFKVPCHASVVMRQALNDATAPCMNTACADALYVAHRTHPPRYLACGP